MRFSNVVIWSYVFGKFAKVVLSKSDQLKSSCCLFLLWFSPTLPSCQWHWSGCGHSWNLRGNGIADTFGLGLMGCLYGLQSLLGVDNLLLDVTAGMAFSLLLPCLPAYPALDQENLVLEISWWCESPLQYLIPEVCG